MYLASQNKEHCIVLYCIINNQYSPTMMLMTGQLSHKKSSLTVNGDIEGVMRPVVVPQ